MRILRVHNRYQQPGGEDVSFASEVRLLRDRGDDVATLVVSNDTLAGARSPLATARLAASTVWSRSGRARVTQAIADHRPDVVHFDNTFPLLSPAAYSASADHPVAVVQTLHNYRLLCPSATLFRDGRPCHDCLGRTPPLPGVVHACYRGSAAQSAVVAAMLTAHRVRGTWTRDVHRYIALTEFARDLFVAGGLPAARVAVKPNFVDLPPSVDDVPRRPSFLFVGRLSPEKGVHTLLAAAEHLPAGYHLQVVGDGELAPAVAAASAANPAIVPLGRLDRDGVMAAMRSARALVFPSLWYEGCPMTIIEAFAAGLPVIASRLGAMAELVHDGRDGLLFEPGSVADLARVLDWAAAHPTDLARMGANARLEYESRYTPGLNYAKLTDIYRQAISTAAHAVPG